MGKWQVNGRSLKYENSVVGSESGRINMSRSQGIVDVTPTRSDLKLCRLTHWVLSREKKSD